MLGPKKVQGLGELNGLGSLGRRTQFGRHRGSDE